MSTENLSPDAIGQEAVVVAQQAETRKREKERRRLLRLKIMFPFLLVLVFLVYGFTTNYIPSESMLPTLKPGDHTLTMRAWLAYFGGRMPARGDIIVFRLPKEQREENDPGAEKETDGADSSGGRRSIGVFKTPPGEILIKRVVGLPGETVQVQGSAVFINGKKIPKDYLTESVDPDLLGNFNFAEDQPLKLGPDELFVLGDNPNNSEDGRFWGPLKRSNILGKFVGVLFHEGTNGPNQKKAREEDGAAQETPPPR